MANDDHMDVDSSPPTPAVVSFDSEARERDLDEKYPHRPRNHGTTLPFHTLFRDVFNPLKALEAKKATGPLPLRGRAVGPDGKLTKQEKKKAVLERYFSRWRREVGDDIYPAIRLMIPEMDRDRAMYGLKEKILGKYIVKILKIDKNAEDAFNLLNWKRPDQNSGQSAGDFAGRCYTALAKRPFRTEVGHLTIGEVNDMLEQLAADPKEENQIPVMENLYRQMNAEELMWLIRIILRQMKIGSTEKTIFENFHADAQSLFSISSSLRRVCWDLWSPNIRIDGEDRGVTLMQCFQPQLAWYDKGYTNARALARMRPTEEDDEFWIEDKLDGERMQMHMVKDDKIEGGRRFRFWSRKAKDYTYLYGEGLYDKDSALTQHLRDAFDDAVENIILDGEMITWDPEIDHICAFGTLKTAAISEGQNPWSGKARPLFRVFDILLLNDKKLTSYMLRDRRRALERAVNPVHRRFEIHSYVPATKAEQIDMNLSSVIEQGAEGLVLKSPRSAYAMASRNEDWIKVKPEYMRDEGESFDCLVVGGYFGSGRRGGHHSSYLCGLRADSKDGNPQKFISFFKVGGGLDGNDYARIRYLTQDKWHDYNPKKPPNDWLELAGGSKLTERPDQWIKAEDSVAIEGKGAQITESDEFAIGLTLRFPKFKRLRTDKDWKTVLSVDDFRNLKATIEKNQVAKKFEVEQQRRSHRKANTRKKPLRVIGYAGEVKIDSEAQRGRVFLGQTFYIMTESTNPSKKSKKELEDLVKQYGGKIIQNHNHPSSSTTSPTQNNAGEALPPVICIASSNKPRVASLKKRGDILLIKPLWLFDCISQADINFAQGLSETPLVFEPDRHIYFIPEEYKYKAENNVDAYGDAHYRDTTLDELQDLLSAMSGYSKPTSAAISKARSLVEDAETETKGWLFKDCTLYFDLPSQADINGNTNPVTSSSSTLPISQARTTALFAGASLSSTLSDETMTHIVVSSASDVKAIRKQVADLYRAGRQKVPRVVSWEWIQTCWSEGTRLDEDRFVP